MCAQIEEYQVETRQMLTYTRFIIITEYACIAALNYKR